MWLWPKFAHSKMSPSSSAPYNNFIKGLLIQQNAKFQQSMLSLKFYPKLQLLQKTYCSETND